nr:MAG: hypothetical protein EDM05_34265 [Leptolyngbya sp. IPPAS B-1204]
MKPFSALILQVFVPYLALGQVISMHPDVRLLLLTGFLGSYTTFSSYELDSAHLLQQDRLGADLFYWVGSMTLGFMSLQVGISLAEWLLGKLDPLGETPHNRDQSN